MSKDKAKNNGVAVLDAPSNETQTLLRINFDELDSIPEIEPTESEPAQPEIEEQSVDTEEQVLSTVESFDEVYGADPLKAEWLAWGNAIKADVDNVDMAKRYVEYGRGLDVLMHREKNKAPNSYDRAKVMKKGANVLQMCNVPDYMVKPQELAAVYQVVRLDRSTPATEQGEPRTFATDAIPDDWFGGNITIGALRVLAKAISKASKPEETDVWDYREGYEAWARDMIKRLRDGQLSIRQVDALFDSKKKALADAKKRAKYAGLTKDQIASIEASERNVTLQAKLNELGSDAVTFAKKYAEELKKSPADLKDFLVNKQVIPADQPKLTPAQYAAVMTPGDAKALVQELVKLYGTGKTDRLPVFKALYATSKAVVDQIKSAQESAKTAKVA